MILKNKENLQFEEMCNSIGKILNPIGMMPDKASLDYGQILKLYLELKKIDGMFRDLMQISRLQKELASSLFQNLVN